MKASNIPYDLRDEYDDISGAPNYAADSEWCDYDTPLYLYEDDYDWYEPPDAELDEAWGEDDPAALAHGLSC